MKGKAPILKIMCYLFLGLVGLFILYSLFTREGVTDPVLSDNYKPEQSDSYKLEENDDYKGDKSDDFVASEAEDLNQESVLESSNDLSKGEETMKQISDAYMENVKTTLVSSMPDDATTRRSDVQYGTITKKQYYSSVTDRLTNLNVMLPADYDASKKYPVLYLLHGYWGTEDSLIDAGDASLKINEIISNLTAEGAAKEMIVVFPYIYTSKEQISCSAMDLANSLAYDNFINALITDIMPFINTEYATLTDRENTAIAGFSMGGREALYIGITRPDLFGYVGGFCPAPGLTPGTDINMHPGQLQLNEFKIQDEDNMPYLLMIVGGTNDSVVYKRPYQYHNILDINHMNNVWLEVPHGGHDGSTIRPGVYNFVRSIFKN